MGKKILLIDDSAMLRRIAASVLGSQAARYEVLAATRAAEGFARACGSGVDLILVDQRLLDLHGEDLTRRLLADPRTARVPVVLLIGRGAAAPATASLPENVVETLQKPFAPEQLAAAVNAIVGAVGAGAGFRELRAQRSPAPATRTTPAETPFRAAEEDLAPARPAESAPPVAPSAEQSVARRNLDTLSLQAVLADAAQERFTGALLFRSPEMATVEVLTENGRIVVVTTRDGPAYGEGALGMLPPKISQATLDAALQEQCRCAAPCFFTLGAWGLLSKSAAVSLLHRFGQRCFSRLWTLPQATLTCGFEKMRTLPVFALRLEPRQESLEEWLLGTMRHVGAEDVAAIAQHEGFVGTPYFQPGGEKLIESLPLTVMERSFADLIDGRNDLPAISRKLGLTPEAAFLTLFRYRGLEAMGYRTAPAAFTVAPKSTLRRVLPLKRWV